MSSSLEAFLGPELLLLYQDGEKLLSTVNPVYSDYSFIVFPFAKVYEGFLKKLFLQIGAINEFQYNNDRWRVGRALNPQLEKDQRHTESVYDRIVSLCGPAFAQGSGEARGISLAETLWEAWKKGRNQIFHFWPGRSRPLSLNEARGIILELEQAMEAALTECKT